MGNLYRLMRGYATGGYVGTPGSMADSRSQASGKFEQNITKDKCSKCLSGCKFRNNVGNFGGFLSINKLSQ